MPKHLKTIERHGRMWSITKVRHEEAEEEDFRFWYEGLTPDERVEAVDQATLQSLKTRGLDGVPRLRRVLRRLKRT